MRPAMLGALLLSLLAQDVRTATAGLGLDALPPPAPDRVLLLTPDLALHLSAGSEWDTNARRVTTSQGAAGGPSDGVVRIVGDLRARLPITTRDQVTARYVIGVKRFFREDREDLFVHDLSVDGVAALTDTIDIDARGRYRASSIRNRTRDYALTHAGAGFTWRPYERWSLSAEGAYQALDFGPTCLLSYEGPAISGSVGWRPFDRVELGASGGFGWRIYDGRYDPTQGLLVGLCTASAGRRRDGEPYASLHATYRGTIIVGGEVVGRFSRSNDDGENIDRYRISGWVTVPLPLELVLSASGALQFNRGISVSQSLQAVEDDENQTGIELQLARPIAAGIEAIGRYSLYANAFATAPDEFVRHTFYLGLSYEIGAD